MADNRCQVPIAVAAGVLDKGANLPERSSLPDDSVSCSASDLLLNVTLIPDRNSTAGRRVIGSLPGSAS